MADCLIIYCHSLYFSLWKLRNFSYPDFRSIFFWWTIHLRRDCAVPSNIYSLLMIKLGRGPYIEYCLINIIKIYHQIPFIFVPWKGTFSSRFFVAFRIIAPAVLARISEEDWFFYRFALFISAGQTPFSKSKFAIVTGGNYFPMKMAFGR